MKSSISFSSLLGAVLFIFVAWAYKSTPPAVVPPFVPKDSPTLSVAPWYIYAPTKALVDLHVYLTQTFAPPNLYVFDIATGYWRSEVLYALVKNGMIDVVAKGPKTCAQVAQELELLEEPTCQFMQAGAAVGLLKRQGKAFVLTKHSKALRTDADDSLRDFVLNWNRDSFKNAWRAAATESLRKPESGMQLATGQDLWSLLDPNPEESALYDRAMTQFSQRQVGAILTSWKPPKRDIKFCDIGGGGGKTTMTVLEHYPSATGIVFDQPQAAGRTTENLAKKGLADRAKAVGGSFLEPFPDDLKSCDVFFMKFIIHDWPDAECITILKHIKAVAKPGAKLVVADQVIDPSKGMKSDIASTLASVHMLALFRAKERTIPEFKDLFQAAGLTQPVNVINTRDVVSILEVNLA